MWLNRIEKALVPWAPCMVTAVRLALAPIIAYLFAHQLVIPAVALFVLAAWTDWLDGVLARALHAESDFGAFLDATIDKLLILPILFVASRAMVLVWALFAIEAILIVLRLPRLVNHRVNVYAGRMGKCKFSIEVIAVLEIMIFKSAGLLPVAIGLGILSVIEHLTHYRK